ncbi:MAG: DinB family protein [Bacteroidota bacterium]
MQPELSLLLQTRKNLVQRLAGFSLEQLNHIPQGFNNNLIWNLGHVLITQRLLTYGRSGLPLDVEPALVDAYRKGSKPNGDATADELNFFLQALEPAVHQLQADYVSGKFDKFQPYATSYGYQLDSVEDALRFNNAHEAMHLGAVIALSKLV